MKQSGPDSIHVCSGCRYSVAPTSQCTHIARAAEQNPSILCSRQKSGIPASWRGLDKVPGSTTAVPADVPASTTAVPAHVPASTTAAPADVGASPLHRYSTECKVEAEHTMCNTGAARITCSSAKAAPGHLQAPPGQMCQRRPCTAWRRSHRPSMSLQQRSLLWTRGPRQSCMMTSWTVCLWPKAWLRKP